MSRGVMPFQHESLPGRVVFGAGSVDQVAGETERMGLQMLTRRMAQKSMEGDFETDSMRYKVTSRWVPGWTNWRTVVGTPGA